MRTDQYQSYVLSSLNGYWSKSANTLLALPITSIPFSQIILPPKMKLITLPEWAHNLGVEKGLFVPLCLIAEGNNPEWHRVDWFKVIFWFLNGLAERSYEDNNTIIHSYSYRLKNWDPMLWQYAWVNRIALFLRRWAARHANCDEITLFGELPTSNIILTHDVDAINKTFPIRFKQATFNLINSARYLGKLKLQIALNKLQQAKNFIFSNASYSNIEYMLKSEEKFGLRSHFNFYSNAPSSFNPKTYLFDPSYNLANLKLARQLRLLIREGWQVGLHQSFDAWQNQQLMSIQKQRLERVTGTTVDSCRQHWLRFSWNNTWQTQESTGFKLDTTLGFNDRPGFRTGAALRYHPWNFEVNQPMKLACIPLVFMDSHFYDYLLLGEDERFKKLQRWLDEIHFVRGEATVLWHPHTLSTDYGWLPGYEYLLSVLQ